MRYEWIDRQLGPSPPSFEGRRLILQLWSPILMGLKVEGLQDLQSRILLRILIIFILNSNCLLSRTK